MEDSQNFSVLTAEQVEELNKEHFIDENLRNLAAQNGIKYQPELSVSLQRVIQRAAMHIQSAGKSSIQSLNLLVALMQEDESYGKKLLDQQGITRLRILEEVSHGLEEAIHEKSQEEPSPDQGKRKQVDVLENFAVNLIQEARKVELIQLLVEMKKSKGFKSSSKKKKNNPLIVGDAGVGKTALIEGFALLVSEEKVANHFKDAKIYTLDIASVLAGAKFRGDFEQRLKSILESVYQMKRRQKKRLSYLSMKFIQLWALEQLVDASNLLKPYLSAGKIKIIGSTTHDEYRKFVEKDAAFRRRFQKVDLDEPSREESVKILMVLLKSCRITTKLKYQKEW